MIRVVVNRPYTWMEKLWALEAALEEGGEPDGGSDYSE